MLQVFPPEARTVKVLKPLIDFCSKSTTATSEVNASEINESVSELEGEKWKEEEIRETGSFVSK